MPDRPRVPLARALEVAEALVDGLRPVCDRIEIAGSIRRRAASVKDIELVAIPSGIARDLFGVVDVAARVPLDDVIDGLIAEGRLRPRLTSAGVARMGRRYKALEVVSTWSRPLREGPAPAAAGSGASVAASSISLDLFLVLPPASWGALFAIRTGPAEYSQRLVTECQRRGLRMEDGRLVRIDHRSRVERAGREADVRTPEERDFIHACGMPWVDPEQR